MNFSRTWAGVRKARRSIVGIRKAITRRTIVGGPASKTQNNNAVQLLARGASRAARKQRNKARPLRSGEY